MEVIYMAYTQNREAAAENAKGRCGHGPGAGASVRTLILELVDDRGASHIRELHIEVLRQRPGTPEHTVRARLSEAVGEGLLDRLGSGFYDIYAEDEGMTSVVSYPQRCSLWGDARYRGNCDGRLFKNLVLRYGARRVADPMVGSGTTKDVIAGLNRYTRANIAFWGSDLRQGFDLTQQELPGRYDFIWTHPPYWNIVRYESGQNDLSSCGDYEEFRKPLMACLKRCYDALLPGGRLAVLIGDVRRKGRYTPIIRDVLNFPHGEVRSVIIKVQHNCTSDRKRYGKLIDPPIKHEYCVVFQKEEAPPACRPGLQAPEVSHDGNLARA
jgi:DNA methylase